MLKKLELLTSCSCLNKAESEEPLFVIRAKDPIAFMTIMHWATMSEGLHEPEKIAEARKFAQEMEDWRSRNIPQAVNPSPVMKRAF